MTPPSRGLARFERKVLAAIGLVAVAPLLGALVLGGDALRSAYATGVNDEVRAQLEAHVALYREHLELLRADAERTADAIGLNVRLDRLLREDDRAALVDYLEEELARHPHVRRLVVRRGGEELARAESPMGAAERPLFLDRTVPPRAPAPGLEAEEPAPLETVRVVVTAPVAIFEGYQAAGDITEVYGRLVEEAELVEGTYVGYYVLALALLISAVLVVGVVVSRRVTGRVVDLAEAARRVGAGDLDVHVPTDARDEVAELTGAFNAMVRDLRENQARIAYLRRIGAWQEFARRLAHEIKNPLTPIQLAVQELHRSYTGEDDAYRRKLDDAHAIVGEEIATLRRLPGEFSAFAKLPTATLAPADVGDFLHDVELALPAIAEDVYGDRGAGPKVALSFPPEPVPVRIDAMMMKRALDNLVRNAFQAMRGREGEVRIAAVRHGAEVAIGVEDDGPGVPERARERVFDPYFTTKAEGTGLGLPIVKKVALEHGGDLSVQAAAGGGARFVLTLPVDESARAERPPTRRRRLL
ncbi:MAG: ATP-binding protein [Myxococcota bacterium]